MYFRLMLMVKGKGKLFLGKDTSHIPLYNLTINFIYILMLRFELSGYMPALVRADVIGRIKRELLNVRTTSLRIVLRAGAKIPRSIKNNSRVTISTM